MAKIGTEYARDMIGRGFRELGGTLYADSNVAQPMYPLRGGPGPPKEAESPAIDDGVGSILGDRIKQAEASHALHGRDDIHKGLDKE
jgi:hypothetical protein